MNNKIHEEELKELLHPSKIKANENLKHRIMQQIETEKALSPNKKTQSSFSIVKHTLSTMGVMYTIVAALGFYCYLSSGIKGLTSSTFVLSACITVVICTLFSTISVFDEQIRNKKNKHKRN